MITTRYRNIVTPIPVPESLPLLERLAEAEPRSMGGLPQVIWERAEGFQVFDPWDNCWIDFSSGVLVANAGHGRKEIRDAIEQTLKQGLHHNYVFPSRVRLELVETIRELLPPPLDKVFLLTTGAETVECAIKIARTQGFKLAGPDKITVVSFKNAFHGRTMGAQMAGGIPALKDWIVNLDPAMIQVPFPDEAGSQFCDFAQFEQSLADVKVKPENVAGVLLETYQGGMAAFAPAAYIQALRKWCDRYNAVLIMDEVQAGFGRTGRLFGFEHYGVVPDIACFGKGISSGMPISAVVGRRDLMDLYGPGSMTSTHTGNPIACRAAKANIDAIVREHLPERAAALGEHLHARLRDLQASRPGNILPIRGKGMVAGVPFVDHTGAPDAKTARALVDYCVENGVLLFSPVGPGSATIKINPPLVIAEEALMEGLDVFVAGARQLCKPGAALALKGQAV